MPPGAYSVCPRSCGSERRVARSWRGDRGPEQALSTVTLRSGPNVKIFVLTRSYLDPIVVILVRGASVGRLESAALHSSAQLGEPCRVETGVWGYERRA
jgi:hypothetical protein